MPTYVSKPQREALMEVVEMINQATPSQGDTCLKLILGILNVSMDGGPVQDLTFKGGDIHLVPCHNGDQNSLIQTDITTVQRNYPDGVVYEIRN
jgi:hypothetical protein